MLIARSRQELAQALATLRTARGDIAFVPTMGALHAGHISLIAIGRRLAPAVAASIFVNPTQFAAGEDFDRYPRTEEADIAQLRDAGCDLVWLPGVADIYPPEDSTSVEVAGPALGYEGAVRPGHFRGVATVVAKLFGLVRPRAAVFGEKDWQQLQVIRRMVADLGLPVIIEGAPVVREADGLALSSRNRFLSAEERSRAPALHAALLRMRDALAAGADAAAAAETGRSFLETAGLAPDYLALVDGETLKPAERPDAAARLLGAARLGRVRLLDNIAAG